jgi:hypothetical protein
LDVARARKAASSGKKLAAETDVLSFSDTQRAPGGFRIQEKTAQAGHFQETLVSAKP